MNNHAKWRSVHQSLFFDIEYRTQLTPDARNLFLNLRLMANVPAFYRPDWALIMELTGFDWPKVQSLLKELSAKPWVKEQHGYVWIVNGMKHDPGLQEPSIKIAPLIVYELSTIPDCQLKRDFIDSLSDTPWNTLCDTLSGKVSDTQSDRVGGETRNEKRETREYIPLRGEAKSQPTVKDSGVEPEKPKKVKKEPTEKDLPDCVNSKDYYISVNRLLAFIWAPPKDRAFPEREYRLRCVKLWQDRFLEVWGHKWEPAEGDTKALAAKVVELRNAKPDTRDRLSNYFESCKRAKSADFKIPSLVNPREMRDVLNHLNEFVIVRDAPQGKTKAMSAVEVAERLARGESL